LGLRGKCCIRLAEWPPPSPEPPATRPSRTPRIYPARGSFLCSALSLRCFPSPQSFEELFAMASKSKKRAALKRLVRQILPSEKHINVLIGRTSAKLPELLTR
jgi:hypothetical protein